MSLVRCAVYTRKSSEEGLEQSFNSLHAQREACEAYILSQRHEGWQLIPTAYDDGGFSGGSMERPALKRLLDDIALKRIDTVVVYKVDRLTRSLSDFARIVEQFDKQGISFVSVTQQFNTTTSMGRLTLNVLLSFAQFEREVTGERIRDKIAASKKKGIWMGGVVPIGYDLKDRQLIINSAEAECVREIYNLYLKMGCVSRLQAHLNQMGVRSKQRLSRTGNSSGGAIYSRGALYGMLHNRIYLGEIKHKDKSFPGQHPPIIDRELWDQVQAQFESNLQAPRKRPRTTSQSLRMGLLYDEKGNRFTPSHSTKNGRHYRYYVSQAAMQGKKDRHSISRLPAQEIEDLVVSWLRSLLGSAQRLIDILNQGSDPRVAAAIVEASREWVKASNDKVQNSLASIVTKVVVRARWIEMLISRSKLFEFILPDMQQHDHEGVGHDDMVAIFKQIDFERYGGEIRLTIPGEDHQTHRAEPSLVRALARAQDWLDRILSGEARQRDIAEESKLDKRYVSTILQLAFLAPDIKEAILQGNQSPHLTLEVCAKGIPASWTEQRKLFQMS